MWLRGNSKVFLNLVLILIPVVKCVQFNRLTTGVDFSVYVKKSENGEPIPGWKSYKMEDIKTMLRVISGKFSRVATYGVGADNVPHVGNQTYWDSNAQVMAAEAAALINHETKNKTLTMIVGIWKSSIKQQMDSEVQVAFECVQRAHEIYPGTVEGLVFSHGEIGTSLKWAKQTLEWIKEIRNKTVNDLGVKLGSRQKCYELTPDNPEDPTSEESKLLLARQQIVKHSDFIICEVDPSIHAVQSGAKNGFVTVGNDLLVFRSDFKKINPNIEVMGQTKWPSSGDKPWENIDNMKEYWIEVDAWALKNNFTMWLLEAFDNPWKNWSPNGAYYGWWRLRSNKEIDNVDGYIEKIYDKHNDSTWKEWIYFAIVVGLIIGGGVTGLVAFLFLRVNKLQTALDKEKDEVTETEEIGCVYRVLEEEEEQTGQESTQTGASSA